MIKIAVILLFVELLIILSFFRWTSNRIYLIMSIFLVISGVVAVVNYKIQFFPIKGVGESLYDMLSVSISESWKRGRFLEFSPLVSHNLFAILTGAPFYLIFGQSLMFIKLANISWSVLTVYYVYRISSLLFNRCNTGLHAAVLFAFSPYLLFTCGSEVRDPLVVFMLSGITYQCTYLVQFGKIRKLPLLLVYFVGVVILRPELGPVIVASVVVVVVMKVAKSESSVLLLRSIRKSVALFVVLAVVSGGAYIMVNAPVIIGFGKGISLQRLEARRNPHGKSAYLNDVRLDSPEAVAKNLPVSTLYFMFSPLPWQVRDFKLLLGMIDSLYLLSAFFLSYRGYKQLYRNNKTLFWGITLYLFIGILGCALIQANIGAAMRHRMQFSFIFYILASYRMESIIRRIRPALNFRLMAFRP
jgi:hypothetical protein